MEQVRRNLARLSDTIPAIYVPGFNDIADSSAGAAAPCPSPASIQAYRSKFGADYFGFWYGGLRGLVVNSSLMIYPQCAAEEAALQDTWLMEELEQAKLCSQAICIFTFTRGSYANWTSPIHCVLTSLALGRQQGQGQVMCMRAFPASSD